MSSPVSARSGILWAGAGMVVATLVTFLYPGMTNYELIMPAMFVGAGLAWWSGKRVAMTDMPQMIALYNGMGGGAAAAIAAVELYRGESARLRGAARSPWPAASSARCPSAAAPSPSASCRASSSAASASAASRS